MMTSVEVAVGEEGAKPTAAVEETGMREDVTMVEERSVMAGEMRSGFAALTMAAMAAMEGEVAAMAAEGEVAEVAVAGASMKLAGSLLSEFAELAEGAMAEVVAEVTVAAAICAAWEALSGMVSVGAILDCEG